MEESTHRQMKRGQRLRIARTLSGLTRDAFAKKHNLSLHTLRSCELENLEVSYKTADKVSKALEQEGIFCTTDWIMEGRGSYPVPVSKPTSESLLSLSEEHAILREVDVFRKENPSSVVLELTDDAMSPLYKPKDIVGGKRVPDPLKLIGKICLVELHPDLFLLRKLSKDAQNKVWVLSSLNIETTITEPTLKTEKIISAAPLLWFRRPLSSALE